MGAEGEVEVEEEADDCPSGGAERGIMERYAKEGANPGPHEKIAAQAHKPGPLSLQPSWPKHCSFRRRLSQRRSTSAWIWAMSSFPLGSRKR